MNVDKFGIVVTIIVLVGILGVAGIGSGELGSLGIDSSTSEKKNWLPQINAGTDTSRDGFYDYCYRMGLEC